MEIASLQECGSVIHELFAGMDEKTAVWDPVLRRAVYQGPQQRYSTAEEARLEAELDARTGEKRRTKPKRKSGRGTLDLSDWEAFDQEIFQREMNRKKLGIEEFRGAIRAGGFKAVHLVAQGPFFLIQGEPQGRNAKTGLVVCDSTWLTLVTKRDRRNRMFLNPTAALVMLQELGVKSVQVDLESWRPNQPTDNARRRPDLAERLQFAHEYAREGSKQEES